MSSKLNKPVKMRRTESEISGLMDIFDKGGMRVKDFCELHNISDATFYNWRKKYPPVKTAPSEGFIEIIPSLPARDLPEERLFAKVGEIYLYQPVGPDYLKSLLA